MKVRRARLRPRPHRLAVSDPTGTLARPRGRGRARAHARRAWRGCCARIAELEPERIVVGLPLTLRGERGEQAEETLGFVSELRARCPMPVETYDERFTTTLAARGRWTPADDARGRRPPARGISDDGSPARSLLACSRGRGAAPSSTASAACCPDSSKPPADPHGPPITVVIPRGPDAVGDRRHPRASAGVVVGRRPLPRLRQGQGQGTDFKAGTYQFQAGTDYDAIIASSTRARSPPVVEAGDPRGLPDHPDRGRAAVGRDVAAAPTSRAVRAAPPPPGFGHHMTHGGLPVPGHLRRSGATRSRDPGRPAAGGVPETRSAQVDMTYAQLQEPDRLRRADDRLDDRARGAGPERPRKIAAVIYNRLHLQMPLGIDATLLYEHGSWTHQLTESELATHDAVQHAGAPRPAADADLQPGPGVAAGGRASGERGLPLLRRQRDSGSHVLHEQLPATSSPMAADRRSAAPPGWPG